MAEAAGRPVVDRLASTRKLWSQGDYASVGDLFASAGEALVERVDVAGLDVLDVATGTGNTALAAARAGAARVVGIDLTPELLAEAARRGDQGGWAVEWQHGDMEALAVPDAAFDRVLSSFGAMFATDQRATAAGLVRACRPGGRIGVTAWALGGVFDRMSTVLAELLPSPPPPGPSPRDWSSAASLEPIFAGLPVRTTVEERVAGAWFPSPAAAVELIETGAPPILAAREILAGAGRWEEAHSRLGELFERAMVDDGGRWRLDLAYTVAVFDVAS